VEGGTGVEVEAFVDFGEITPTDEVAVLVDVVFDLFAGLSWTVALGRDGLRRWKHNNRIIAAAQ
jgi:hypothetical protein